MAKGVLFLFLLKKYVNATKELGWRGMVVKARKRYESCNIERDELRAKIWPRSRKAPPGCFWERKA